MPPFFLFETDIYNGFGVSALTGPEAFKWSDLPQCTLRDYFVSYLNSKNSKEAL